MNLINTEEAEKAAREIAEIKKSMLDYRDYFGGTLINHSEIESCTTKDELEELIQAHHDFIESMATDAQSSLNGFKNKIFKS